ncbi:MAG: acetyl-CoA hydrolase/transferase C-terminal domain-containing protein, partial [Dehalococcoidia bacterium]|nr:acetyl-CoA hydrolase/transferase C-terminal domain-containing protein [Dehalococcoidia bacterium]
YKRKLVSAEEAVKVVKSGDKVLIAWLSGAPVTLCQALSKRKDELENVTINETIAWVHFAWHEPGTEKAFKLIKCHLVGVDHDALEDGRRMEFVPWYTWHPRDQMAPGDEVGGAVGVYDADVFMVLITAPDKNGFCSFGDVVWASKTASRHAKIVIGEVNESPIRTYGDNYIHVSEIDYFVENKSAMPETISAPPRTHHASSHAAKGRTDAETASIEVIGETVATDIIRDGDTLEMGVGMVSSAIPAYLYNKHDIGIHSEGYPGAIVDLVRDGIVTGKRKTLNPGKVVATTMFRASPEQKVYANENPVFELRDVSYTNSFRVIIAHDNLVAINTALSVDLTGQIASESIGPRLVGASGGQTDFQIGAHHSRGGRGVTVLLSTAKEGKLSRIVPGFEPGTIVTIPRPYADYIVTEYGMARLRGKSLRERINELIAIAHPDFRAELRNEAKRLYGIWM